MFDFKNASETELNRKFAQIAHESGDDQFFTKKELKYLPNTLMANEQVLAFSSGFMDGNTWLIALTDKRVIFLDKGFFYGLKQTAIPIKKIQGVSVETGMMFGKIAINDGFAQRKISQVSKASVATFSRKLTELMDESG